ncbi:MAG: flagellar basal body L-ring protein FlgH [Rhodobiaceae bacterium]|nr:flagellar basal body L-ring protein FlgH [Rhodobiaceae bacterium]
MSWLTTASRSIPRLAALAAIAGALSACSAVDRLKNIGEAPPLSAISNPTAQAGYRPVRMPMPQQSPAFYQPNSLWQSGARAFFKDQRARQIGDILTVRVKIDDEAKIDNATSRKRSAADNMGLEAFAGFEATLAQKILANGADPADLIKTNSDTNTSGSGSIQRGEAVTTNVAAVVTQVLPNGNLVIEGRQEIRVNFEVRELIVAGIVRPEDIANDNTIESTKIAEARIAYGGRGQITDMQQPRYGQQVLDVLLPF